MNLTSEHCEASYLFDFVYKHSMSLSFLYWYLGNDTSSGKHPFGTGNEIWLKSKIILYCNIFPDLKIVICFS